MPTFQYHIFLCHHSADKPAVIALKKALTDQKLTAWLDKDELPPGQNWQPLLEAGLRNSQAIAVCVGHSGIGPWQDEEIQSALRLAVKDKRPVIPILLPGAPHEPDLPAFLSNRTWIDGRTGITAEILLHIEWGITGVKPPGISAGHIPPPPPLDPEARVRQVFGPVYGVLKEILDRHPGLREALSRCYGLPNDSSPSTAARLIVAFQSNFLQALAYFSNLYEEQAAGAEVMLELVCSVIYLSMCPEGADRVSQQPSQRQFEVAQDAKNGIAEMLITWKRHGGAVPVPSLNLGREKNPEIFETPPHLMPDAIMHSLMSRMGIDKHARNAEKILEARLQFFDLKNRPEILTLHAKNESDKQAIQILEEGRWFRHLVLLIKAEGASINPARNAEQKDYDLRFEEDLSLVLKQLGAVK